ncbi:MAG: 16S rRNA (cytidine(1402)-2'-O)-methyltransferase [Patescibacteria group bacterium]
MGKLFILATPIGNLRDITLRALQVLREADFVLAEDTRVIQKLLNHYEIKKPAISFFEHSPQSKINQLTNLLKEGKNLVLVSDAGTPNLSDPGYKLIRAAADNGVDIMPIPGPSSLTALISTAHFPLNEFVFLGFPPHKKGRNKFFDQISSEKRPVILFESTHRILKTVSELVKVCPARDMILAKELTKVYERTWRGSVENVYNELSHLPKENLKGEFVMAIK